MNGICDALINAKIIDSESHEGIFFCLNHCPYPDCLSRVAPPEVVKKSNVNLQRAVELCKTGRSTLEIAREMAMSKRQVQRYLKGN